MTNEEKKAILKQYIGLEKRIARLLDEKKKWKEKAEAISPVYSDMPKAGGCDKIQNAVCKAAVKQMDDEKLRDVMMYRYIDGLKLEEIAIEMSYSYMQIYRLHKKAISEIML